MNMKEISNNSCGVCIDKGTVDAIFSTSNNVDGNKKDILSKVKLTLNEIKRCLIKDSPFILISSIGILYVNKLVYNYQ